MNADVKFLTLTPASTDVGEKIALLVSQGWEIVSAVSGEEASICYVLRAHVHEFIIPVEVRPLYAKQDVPALGLKDHEYKDGTQITKLRCRCGEEKDRS